MSGYAEFRIYSASGVEPAEALGSPSAPALARRNGTGTGVPAALPRPETSGFWVRTLNVGLAAIALIALSPFIALVALVIKLTSPGPVFYVQTRVGMDRRDGALDVGDPERRVHDLGGRPFRMYKFRTMQTAAERGTGPVWARPNDGRVTGIGKFLRRYRVDEVPQLFNVIRGDMNIAGPRPERPTLVAYLSQEVEGYHLRHRVRPGITGWAQINQAYDTTIQSVRSKLMYDLDYVERRSGWFDIYIMLRTIPALLRKKGW